jgi:hypothetical protein
MVDAEISNGRKRAVKPKRSEHLSEWPPKSPEKPEDDELLTTAERAVITLLNSDLDPKDMNAAIANSIRLIQVKNRIKPEAEPGSYWDGDE